MKDRLAPRTARSSLISGVVLSLVGGALVGCAATPRPRPEPAAQDRVLRNPISAPITSVSEDPRDDAVVRIVGAVSCSGTLIADDLVLTAHHCVSRRDARGKVVAADVDAASLHVQLGRDYFPYAEVDVRAIVTPDCGYEQGNGDLAILVLTRKLVGMPTWTPRLDAPPRLGEHADAAGYGRCGDEEGGIHFMPRLGGPISAVSAGQITAQASICPGDSGGPVYDAHDNTTREVIGVVSASVMDHNDTTKDTSYFTRVDVWPQLFIAAREIADGQSAAELPPFRSCDRRGPVPGAD